MRETERKKGRFQDGFFMAQSMSPPDGHCPWGFDERVIYQQG
jgi:hypothetical protein